MGIIKRRFKIGNWKNVFLSFLKLAYLLPFSLETLRYALVAKAFHCKTAFSTTPEFDNSLVAEN